MYCTKCGAKINDGAKFCTECGAKLDQPLVETGKAAPEPIRTAPVVNTAGLPEGIMLRENGDYVWTYQENLWKHTEILSTLLIIIWVLVALLSFLNIGAGLDDFLILFLGIGGFMSLLAVISWVIVNKSHNGWRGLLFTMNENHVIYAELPDSAKKSKAVGEASIIGGILSGDMGLTAAGIAAANQLFVSEYKGVKSIKAVRKHDLIRVNSILTKNTIYCSPEQYEFVFNYIASHCPKARVKR